MQETKDVRFSVRLTPAEKERLQEIANAQHLSLSTFIRSEMLKVADKYDSEK